MWFSLGIKENNLVKGARESMGLLEESRHGRSRLEMHSLVVYIPTWCPTQRVSSDTPNQFQEMKWDGAREIQTPLWCIFQFARPFDRVNSAASLTTRRFGVYFPPPTYVTYLCWKTGRRSCLLGTQDVIQAAQYLAVRNWQPLNCHSSERLRLNKTCQAEQAGV